MLDLDFAKARVNEAMTFLHKTLLAILILFSGGDRELEKHTVVNISCDQKRFGCSPSCVLDFIKHLVSILTSA